MADRDIMTELAVMIDQLTDAVKALTIKLDKLQDEKVQSLSEQMARQDERLKSTEVIASSAKNISDVISNEFSAQKDKVAKLERFFYGMIIFVIIQLIGLLIWLIKIPHAMVILKGISWLR